MKELTEAIVIKEVNKILKEIHPDLTDEEIAYVIVTIREYFSK